jgi:hypothetical protein
MYMLHVYINMYTWMCILMNGTSLYSGFVSLGHMHTSIGQCGQCVYVITFWYITSHQMHFRARINEPNQAK